jgi:hypothetical protein
MVEELAFGFVSRMAECGYTTETRLTIASLAKLPRHNLASGLRSQVRAEAARLAEMLLVCHRLGQLR